MAKTTRSNKATTVEEYLGMLPVTVRSTLQNIRKNIKAAAPGAEELISYQVPCYKLNGMLVGFGAINDHCSFFVMNPPLMRSFAAELNGYDHSGATIRFPLDKPLPAALVRKLVKARIAQNEQRVGTRKTKKVISKKTNPARPDGSADVQAYIKKLKHPFKKEIEAVRKIILGASKNISERVKWNAPSFFYKEDLVTFNCRDTKQVVLVFHHPSIITVRSPLLEGEYRDRRIMYFSDMKAVTKNKNELQRILKELVKKIDKKIRS